MSEAQRELAGVMASVRPGPRYTKPTPKPAARAARGKPSGRLFEALPDWIHVELPALGGHAAVVAYERKRYPLGTLSTRENEPIACIECVRCGAARLQELVDRTFSGGERWDVFPCFDCLNNQGESRNHAD